MKTQQNQQTVELLSLTNDYVFKRVFGEKNLEALADFLSAVLDMPAEELSELEVDNPNLHREYKGGKRGELDIRVHTKSGEIVNIEIQINPEQAFRERIAYYNDRAFTGQIGIGDDYSKLKRTISIIITEFELISENCDCFNRFRWYNIDNGALLTDAQEINTLELAKLSEKDDGTKLWPWLKLMMLRKEDEMEELAKDNTAMNKVIVTLREMSADEAERRLAEAREKEARDRRGAYISGEMVGEARGIEIGEARGIEIGEAQGEAHERQKNARRMKTRGYSADEIADITGMTQEEIEQL
jgi:predicted transposase/invertase (TIGR01784 family)